MKKTPTENRKRLDEYSQDEINSIFARCILRDATLPMNSNDFDMLWNIARGDYILKEDK